jgi:hypothetical protein
VDKTPVCLKEKLPASTHVVENHRICAIKKKNRKKRE